MNKKSYYYIIKFNQFALWKKIAINLFLFWILIAILYFECLAPQIKQLKTISTREMQIKTELVKNYLAIRQLPRLRENYQQVKTKWQKKLNKESPPNMKRFLLALNDIAKQTKIQIEKLRRDRQTSINLTGIGNLNQLLIFTQNIIKRFKSLNISHLVIIKQNQRDLLSLNLELIQYEN